MKKETQIKLRKLIERVLREERNLTFVISDYIADLFSMDFTELKSEVDNEYDFSKWTAGSDYEWIIARGDDFPNSIKILNKKMLSDSDVKELLRFLKQK